MDATVQQQARPTIRAAHPAQRRRRGWVRTLASETLFLLLSLPMGVAMFVIAVCGWATALGSLIAFIGIPVALLTNFATRGMCEVERRRAALVLGARVPALYRVPLPLRRDD